MYLVQGGQKTHYFVHCNDFWYTMYQQFGNFHFQYDGLKINQELIMIIQTDRYVHNMYTYEYNIALQAKLS